MKYGMALGLLLALQPAAAMAAETVSIVGGKLSEPQGLQVTRDHIVVGGLPANWSAGVNVCHTATLGQYPRLRFGFTNGNATVKSLIAQGFILTSGQDGLPTTGLTVCRDGAGNVLSMTVLISLFADEDGTLVDYEVGATNSSPTDGYSYTGVSYLANGGHGGTITAYSSAANLVSIRN